MASEASVAKNTGGNANARNAIRLSERTLAYNRNNPISAIGRRAFSMATRPVPNSSYLDVDRYNRIMGVASRMQDRLRNQKS